MSDKLPASDRHEPESKAAAKLSVEIRSTFFLDQDHKIRGLGAWRYLDDPLFTRTAHCENMSVRSGDKCLTVIKGLDYYLPL